jgi:FAD-dependent urate hydroxylase
LSTEYPPSPSSPEPICCVDDNHQAQNNLTALESAILRDLKMLSYPEPDWVHSRPGILDVLIIGGGQGGLSIAFGLLREKVRNILIIDENPSGREGPWRTFARMKTLRSPKHLTGPDLGIPNLTFQSWYEARFGREAFDNLHLAPKDIWADYLDWYRKLLQLPVQNNTKAGAIQWNEEKQCFAIPITNPNGMDTLLARKVVLATGIDGSGQWDVPAIIRNQVSPHLYAHTHDPIDFEALQGKRIGILGAGASAFDNAITALEVGAQEAHLFFRRAQLPNINPFRWGLFSGYLNHHSDLPDPDRWRFMLYLTRMGMPPPPDTLASALKLPGFHLHPGSPWHRVSQIGKTIRVETPHGQFEFDYLIAGTGTILSIP